MSEQNQNERNNFFSSLEFVNPKSWAQLADQLKGLIRSKLWLQIIIAMLLGIGVGVLLGPTVGLIPADTAKVIGEWIALPGYFFLALIQMIIVPLVFSSVIRGIASNEDVEQLRKTGLRLVIYFLMTTTVAVTLGIVVGLVIQPGTYVDISAQPDMEAEIPTDAEISEGLSIEQIPEQIVGLLPNNPLSAMTNSEMLQIVIFAFAFGLALISMPVKTAKPMLDFLASLEEVCMTIVRWAMLMVPIAVLGLIAKVTLQTGVEVLQSLGFYVATVLIGFLLLLIFYLLVVTVLGRRNPLTFLGKIREPMIMAFSTNSSAATMPVSIQTAEEKLNIQPSIARFIIPIGATVNMDASALYQGLATIFIAQMYGIDLPIATLVVIVLTAVGASIGTPATPGVGIIILSSVLVSVGIPLEGLTLLIGIDRILELFRAALNVTGDLVASTVLDRQSASEEVVPTPAVVSEKSQ
jgi:Na+/H+-dicarboxylate symporter